MELLSVRTNPNYDNNAFDVTITYEIIGANALPQQLEFVLQSTR